MKMHLRLALEHFAPKSLGYSMMSHGSTEENANIDNKIASLLIVA
jgi:hypothetical protein